MVKHLYAIAASWAMTRPRGTVYIASETQFALLRLIKELFSALIFCELEDWFSGDYSRVCAWGQIEKKGGCCYWKKEEYGEGWRHFGPHLRDDECGEENEDEKGAAIPAGIGPAVFFYGGCDAATAEEVVSCGPNLVQFDHRDTIF